MDNKNILEDEFEILDDIEEETILFNESPTTNDRTYIEDNSLQNSGDITVGFSSDDEHTVDDALAKFNTDETPVVMKEMVSNEPSFDIEDVNPKPVLEAPSLSDELDNTLLLAKQAIHPEVVNDVKEIKDESKSNKLFITIVIILFIILAAFALLFPYIVRYINTIK